MLTYKLHSISLLIICLITTLTLAACGFHLRGQRPLPPALKEIYIESANSRDPLIKDLQQSLHSLNITLAEQRSQASVILQATNLGTSRMLSGISADAQIRTYILSSSLQFQLLKSDGQVILPAQTVSVSRNLVTNSDQILSTDYEYDRIQQDMYQDLVTQVLNRLYSAQVEKALQNVKS